MRRSFLVYQIPLLLWILGIFALSSVPTFPLVKTPVGFDKIVHVVIYGVLCWLAWRAFRHQERFSLLQKRALPAAVLFTMLYGILDELHQVFVPGRIPDMYDVIANTAGAFLFAAWHGIRRSRRGGKAGSGASGSVDRS